MFWLSKKTKERGEGWANLSCKEEGDERGVKGSQRIPSRWSLFLSSHVRSLYFSLFSFEFFFVSTVWLRFRSPFINEEDFCYHDMLML